MVDLDQPMAESSLTQERFDIMHAIVEQLDHAYRKHGKELWSRHEFYAILLEEVDELFDAIKQDLTMEEMEIEVKQIQCGLSTHGKQM